MGDIVQAIAHKPGDMKTDVHLIVRRGGDPNPVNITFAPIHTTPVPRITSLGPLIQEWLEP